MVDSVSASVACALTVRPAFIVADEAVSMVDVSIRISLLKMFARLKDEMGVGVLLITHDLALAKYFAWEGRIGVMYLGRLVEIGPAAGVVAILNIHIPRCCCPPSRKRIRMRLVTNSELS